MTDIMDACIVCQSTSSPMVEKPLLAHIKEMVMCSRKRSDLGETKYKKLAEMFSTFSEDDLQNVRYHSACRKLVINKQHIKKVEDRSKASTRLLVQPVLSQEKAFHQRERLKV